MAENMPSGYSSLGGQVLNPYDVSSHAQRLELRVRRRGRARAGHRHGRHRDRRVDPRARVDTRAWSASSRRSGLVPGRGILPIATSQDCAGPMCRTVADAAALLGVLAGETYGEGSGPEHPARCPSRRAATSRATLHEQEAEVFRRGAGRAARPRGGPRRGARAPGDRRVPGAAPRVRPRPRRLPRHAARGRADPHHARAGRLERGPRRRGPEVRPGAAREGARPSTTRPSGRRTRCSGPATSRSAGEHGIDATLTRRGRRGHRVPRAGTAAGTLRGPGYPEPGGAGGLPPREPLAAVGLTFVGPVAQRGAAARARRRRSRRPPKVRKPPSVVNPSLFRDRSRAVAGSPATG